MAVALGLALAASLFFTEDFEELIARQAAKITVRRDYVASVISQENKIQYYDRFQSILLVNGIGMTRLTPITKFMVHLPLAFHSPKPQSVLVVCFGMGTTFRSALTWGIDTTTVELVPSVVKAFAFYHPDAPRLTSDAHGHIIVDDGRRYLRRTDKKFDVIVVDPPPPVEAAGSSLLFSTEFYALAEQHLKPGGIVQMWFPGGEPAIQQAVVRSICEVFPHVRSFPSVEGWGVHLLASMEPMEQLDPAHLVARMPASAQQDLMEWSDTPSILNYVGKVVDHEYPLRSLLNPDASIEVTDDRPFNEYFLLRRLRQRQK
jgi:spermidine synthase